MSKSLFNGGVRSAVCVLLSLFSTPYVVPSHSNAQSSRNRQSHNVATLAHETLPPIAPSVASPIPRNVDINSRTEVSLLTTQNFTATAYSLRGRTASGRMVARGLIAADPRVLPIGTRVYVSAGSHSGEYTVDDTGGAVRGRIIDIWVPSSGEAMRFGRRRVRLTVLQYGGGRARAPLAVYRRR